MIGGGYRLGHKLFETKASSNAMRYFMNDIPILDTISKFYDDTKWVKDYQRNTGIGWEDYEYPTKARGGASFYPTFQTAARSVANLYRENEREEMNRWRKENYRRNMSANYWRERWYKNHL